MDADISQRALPLIEEISRTAADPDRWGAVLDLLSADLGGAAIGVTLEIPNIADSRLSYRCNLDPALNAMTANTIAKNQSPWVMAGLTKGFFRTQPSDPTREVAENEYYKLCLIPQGVAPELPLGHVFAHRAGRDLAAIIIYRMVGGRHFTDEDLAMLNLLVPHMATAFQLHEELRGYRQRRDAMAAVVDRFAQGVVLLDEAGRVVTINQTGERILDADDGLAQSDRRVRASDQASNIALQEQIDGALGTVQDDQPAPLFHENPVAIKRPSGARALSVIVSQLLPQEGRGLPHEATAVLFISDPVGRALPMPDVLRSLYDLTEAESHLASLLCEGLSLEGAAAVRSVTIHTARAQLKSIFAKTGTKRQGDLISLAVGGLSALEPAE